MDAAHVRRRQALLARAAGNDRALLAVLRRSVVDTSADVGGESNPSGFQVHEEIADTLLRLGQPKQAALEYALALAHHPKRARSLLGAARAAVQGGDPETARTRYQQLLEIWTLADDEMEGLAEARAAIATGK